MLLDLLERIKKHCVIKVEISCKTNTSTLEQFRLGKLCVRLKETEY